MNKQWDVNEIEKKWGSTIKKFSFEEKDIQRICEYAERHRLAEFEVTESLKKEGARFTDLKRSLLPISLRILEKVKDLSKVHFVPAPNFTYEKDGKESMKTDSNFQFKTAITSDNIPELRKLDWTIDVIGLVENNIVEKMSAEYNEMIEKGDSIYVYLVVASTTLISTAIGAPEMVVRSRFYADPNPVVSE